MSQETRTPKSGMDKLDSILLAVLILLMCSQLTNLTLGQDTYKTEGYVTKQLFIAVSDIFLILTFAWFCVRTTLMRAWQRVWWPPIACWALIAAMIIAALHSPTIVNAVALKMDEAQGPKAMIKALVEKESKEAIAEIIQFSFYFLIGPLLFVNLMHDRRSGELVSRRKLALHAFSGAVLLTTIIAFIEMLTGREEAPNALFGSPNAYAAFLALALPLSVANILHIWNKPLPPFITTLLAVALGMFTLISPWAAAAILIGIVAAGLLQHQRKRGALTFAVMLVVTLVAWNLPGPLHEPRSDYLTIYGAAVPGEKPEVKKQFIEWYAALGWSRPRNVSNSEVGERQKAFATGVGPGNYQGHIGPYYDALPNAEKMPPDSNNLYLVQTVSLGVLGFGALLWMIGTFAGLAMRARKANPHDWLPAGVLAALISVAFVNLFHAMFVRGTGLVLAFILSLGAVALLDTYTQPASDGDV